MQKETIINELKAQYSRDLRKQLVKTVLSHEKNDDKTAIEQSYNLMNQIFSYVLKGGFSKREKEYRNYGTAQLVLLAQYLQNKGFAFWNLGQSYMPYKLILGAKIFDRDEFLKRWYTESTNF